MLYQFTSLKQLDLRKLMDLYAEGNTVNAEEFYPNIADRSQALKRAEQDFIDFLETGFFTAPDRVYWVLEEDGVWVSAARTCRIEDGLYYLEALETHPGYRRRGYAAKLLGAILDALKQKGAFKLCDCVDKENVPSIKTHEKCGFSVASDPAINYLSGNTCDWEYGMEYSCI